MLDLVIHQLALHRDNGASIVVSRVGDTRIFMLPKRGITWTRLPGRVAEGPHGRKLAVVEVEMPRWLASERGL